MLVPPFDTETDCPSWLTVTCESPLETVMLCPFREICTSPPEADPQVCVVRFMLTLEPLDEDCELCTLTTQLEHEPDEEVDEVAELVLVCWMLPDELVCVTRTVT